MNYSTEQVINGIINYADNEVMHKLPTTGKWIMGTVIGIASNKASKVIDNLKSNPIIVALDIIDENGNIDADTLLQAMKESANHYGNVTLEVPMVGKLTFSSSDIDMLKSYIQ